MADEAPPLSGGTVPAGMFSGTVIQTRYVGVYGYLRALAPDEPVSIARVAAALDTGVEFVAGALRHLEQRGCLVRHRPRTATGQMAPTAWFVTDLPLQLRAAGVTDPREIHQRVQQAFEAAGVAE